MEMMDRKGFALTVDAIIAMSFILIMALALSAQRYNSISESTELAFVNLHYISEDALDVLNKQGILDQIGEYWTSNNTTAANELARLYLDDIVPQNTGYSLWIYNNTSTTGYTVLANNSRVSEDDAIAQTYSLRFLVGYKKGAPVLSSVSRAFLTSIAGKTSFAYAYFGGFEGQGNLTKYLYVPEGSEITGAYMEMDAGSSFNLYINGQTGGCGNPHVPSGDYLSANINETLSSQCAGHFTIGYNTIELKFTSANITDHYIGGGFIRVAYNTTELNELDTLGSGTHEFPGINGLINYYGSFYVPGDLLSITAHLNFYSNYTTFFRIGNVLVDTWQGSGSTRNVTIGNLSDILDEGGLSPADLSEKTIPVRFGTDARIYQSGGVDAVLITDLSGSMAWQIGSPSEDNGVARGCNDSDLYDSDTMKVSLAKCVDKTFIDCLFNDSVNVSNNRLGLVGFTTNADNSNYNHDLSSDKDSLISRIDSYPERAMLILRSSSNWKVASYTNAQQTLIARGDDSWISPTSPKTGCNDYCSLLNTVPSGCKISNWQNLNFNENGWSATNLPKESASEQNYIIYYRRHFTLSSKNFTSATLYLRHSRGVQCYLNEVEIVATSSGVCPSGNYWDSTVAIPASTFRDPGQDNVLACRVRSGTGSSRYGIEFDAELNISCGDTCNPSSTIPSFCAPSSNWTSPTFVDAAWQTTTLPKNNADEQQALFYYRKHFTVQYNISGSGTLYLRNRRGARCYLNGNLINTDTSCETGNYWDNTWPVSSTYFNPAGQDNVLACVVRSGSTSSNQQGIEFDAELTKGSLPSGGTCICCAINKAYNMLQNSGPERKKFIVVMSDGITGYCCGSTYGNCNSQGTSTSGQYSDCSGNWDRCPSGITDCNGAINNAIWSADRSHNDLAATVDAVGFGAVADCYNGNRTLYGIAQAGNGSYLGSTDPEELEEHYCELAKKILNASTKSQLINVTWEFPADSWLSPDSYLSYTYTPNVPDIEYGEITLTYDTPRFNNNVSCTGSFYIPADVSVIDAKATSYSSEHWTDYLEVNSVNNYDLSDYGSNYFNVGDPYVVYMDPANIGSSQTNTVYIQTGDSPTNQTGCSKDNRAILTIKISGGVGYGDSYPIAEGCKWGLGFDDGSSVNDLPIPSDYDGNATCTYPDSNFTINNMDALNDAVYRVMAKLDLDKDGLLDIKFDASQIEIDSSRVGGIRSLYGPVQFKLVVWL